MNRRREGGEEARQKRGREEQGIQAQAKGTRLEADSHFYVFNHRPTD